MLKCIFFKLKSFEYTLILFALSSLTNILSGHSVDKISTALWSIFFCLLVLFIVQLRQYTLLLFVLPSVSLYPSCYLTNNVSSFPLFSRRAILRATTLMQCTQGVHKQFTSPSLLLFLSLRLNVAVLFLHTGDNDLWTSWRFKSSGKRSRNLHQFSQWRISAHACAFPDSSITAC